RCPISHRATPQSPHCAVAPKAENWGTPHKEKARPWEKAGRNPCGPIYVQATAKYRPESKRTMSLTEKSSATTVVGLSAKVIIMAVAKARKPRKPTTAPTPDGSNKPWSVPPEEGDKYRALVALCHFKANGAQYRFMMTLIDRANPENRPL